MQVWQCDQPLLGQQQSQADNDQDDGPNAVRVVHGGVLRVGCDERTVPGRAHEQQAHATNRRFGAVKRAWCAVK